MAQTPRSSSMRPTSHFSPTHIPCSPYTLPPSTPYPFLGNQGGNRGRGVGYTTQKLLCPRTTSTSTTLHPPAPRWFTGRTEERRGSRRAGRTGATPISRREPGRKGRVPSPRRPGCLGTTEERPDGGVGPRKFRNLQETPCPRPGVSGLVDRARCRL